MKPNFEKMALIPAIVQDYKTKEVLMLAYVNEESYNYMLEKGETCFYSRSRKELWHKGETSGNFQIIKGLYLDCDNDTLLIYVNQNETGTCHTGNYSCFFNEIIPFEIFNDKIQIFEEIYDQIQDREKNPNKEEFVGEISGLVYHMLVLMYKSGVSLDDVESKLIERHEKQGNKKKKILEENIRRNYYG